jgi:hypothetical protein
MESACEAPRKPVDLVDSMVATGGEAAGGLMM